MSKEISSNTFHMEHKKPSYLFKEIDRTTYSFHNFFHPYVGEFIKRLNKGDLSDLMRSDLEIENDDFFENTYSIPDEYKSAESKIKVEGFPKTVEFDVDSPYGIYNWEIFYHVPITVATHLSKNQRFQEAQKWFHFVFNPLTDEQVDLDNETARYWNFKDFKQNASKTKLITKLMEELAQGKNSKEIENLTKSISLWQKTPFDPHAIAKFRPLAYQFDVVMKYIDNLVDWGDSLFRQFTIETLNEATQLYVLASNILGERPQEVPSLTKRPIRTYSSIKKHLDEFSNIRVNMENELPLNSTYPNSISGSQAQSLNISKQLYFCIPENKKLLAYWDLVADRLFKIRHCMDIEGNVRQIPLFQPPIDPGMLVKAAASGMNIADMLGELNQPVSNVRFPVIAQKASELINEVKVMGNTLLSLIEKGENEKLTLIRQEQELKILGLSQDIKYMQWQETKASIESLLKTRESAYLRYLHYQLLLGKDESDSSNFATLAIENTEISEDNFDDIYGQLVERYRQTIRPEDYRKEKLGLTGDIGDIGASIALSDNKLSNNLSLNRGENMELNIYGPLTTEFEVASFITTSTLAPALGLIPQFNAHGTPLGVGVASGFGGVQLSKGAGYVAMGLSKVANISTQMGAQSLKLASYQRRIDDWVLQNNLASKELEQIGTQIISSLIREQIAKKDYENHKVQIENSKAIDKFLKEQKFANEELYLWMQGEVSKTYYEFYKLAFDTAKKAEATMKNELMSKEIDDRDFIKFNWDAGRKGLLSGESLALDMKKMELAYMENNKRELEITKHISLAQLFPEALMLLRSDGSCSITLPEWLFDMDYSGHYMRRIKNVSISIPAIVGPHASVNCTLSLSSSEIRTKDSLLNDYYEKQGDDDRFKTITGVFSSIVTSTAQNDSGMFELNFNDSHYLPFEGAGVISTWKIDMPQDNNHFDFDSLSDVVLHIRYTARDGGETLRSVATSNFKTEILEKAVVLFNLKEVFPTEWHRFKNDTEFDGKFEIKPEHLPFVLRPKIDSLVINNDNGSKNIYKEINKTVSKLLESEAPTITLEDRIISVSTDELSKKIDNIYIIFS